MKKLLLLLLIIVLFAPEAQPRESKPEITLDVTYLGTYLDKGFDVYGPGSHSAVKSSLDIKPNDSGFGVNLANFRANSAGFENREKLNYAVYYQNKLFTEHTLATNYKINYCFHHFPDQPRNAANSQEIIVDFAWPKLLSPNLTPRYSFSYETPAGSGYQNRTISGWVHIFGFDYKVSLQNFSQDCKDQAINLTTLIFYNDGFGPGNVDHDFSHMLLGASTRFPLSKNLEFTPAFFYQSSWDDSVNSEDEYWTALQFTYKF